jgi:hypothetical protein
MECKEEDEKLYDEALIAIPSAVNLDPLADRTLEDLRWKCRIQLDLIEEGQDGTEEDDPKPIRQWLAKYGEPSKE